MALAVGGGACAPSTGTLPAEYVGRWFYLGSSGGITGAGRGDEATGYIVIRPDDTIERHAEDGTLVGASAFTAARGPTIFSSDTRWILNPASDMPEVIELSPDGGRMTLSENVYDGFVRAYARSR